MSCPQCVEGYELPGEPKGSMEADFHGAYFTPGRSDQQGGSSCAVILLTDGFGLSLKNCKIIADRIANEVWIPDYFQSHDNPLTLLRGRQTTGSLREVGWSRYRRPEDDCMGLGQVCARGDTAPPHLLCQPPVCRRREACIGLFSHGHRIR